MNAELKRKCFHLSSIAFPILYYFISTKIIIVILAILNLIILTLDINRHVVPKIQGIIDKIFLPIMRPHEYSGSGKLSGTSYMFLGFLVTAIFFDKNVTIVSWLILIFADSAASLLGQKYGTPTTYGKSIEGSAVFLCTSIIVAILSYEFLHLHFSFTKCIIAIFITTIAEFYSKALKVDDNFLIPVTFCFFV